MTLFHQFNVFAASRGEGLRPELRPLLEGAVASPFSEVSMRRIKAGPRPGSEVVSSWANVTPLLTDLAPPVVAAPKLVMQKLSTANPKRDRIV